MKEKGIGPIAAAAIIGIAIIVGTSIYAHYFVSEEVRVEKEKLVKDFVISTNFLENVKSFLPQIFNWCSSNHASACNSVDETKLTDCLEAYMQELAHLESKFKGHPRVTFNKDTCELIGRFEVSYQTSNVYLHDEVEIKSKLR